METPSNRIKITKSKVDSLPFVGKGQPAVVYRDQDLPGFCLRVGEKTKTFYVNRRVNDEERKLVWAKLGTYGAITPEQARRIAFQTIGLMESGINPNKKKKSEALTGKTLREALEEYLKANIHLKVRSAKDYGDILNRYTGNPKMYPYMNWLDRPISVITRMGFRDAYAKLGEQTPSGAEHLLGALHAICEFIVEQYDGAIIAENPIKIRKEFRYRLRPRDHRITDMHLPAFFLAVKKLAENSGSIVGDYLLFTLLTGLRRNESAKLTWADVDFTNHCFTIQDTKNHRPHCLPITAPTLEILKRRHQLRNNDYVFPDSGGVSHLINPRKQMTKVITSMNLEVYPARPLPKLQNGCFTKHDLPKIHFTIHDIRRTFAGIARDEVGGDWTSRLLNHTSAQEGAAVTKRHYLGKENVEDLRIPLDKVAERIMVLSQPTKPISPYNTTYFITGRAFVM